MGCRVRRFGRRSLPLDAGWSLLPRPSDVHDRGPCLEGKDLQVHVHGQRSYSAAPCQVLVGKHGWKQAWEALCMDLSDFQLQTHGADSLV